MPKRINVGIIGMGVISRVYCTNIMSISNANLVAIADIDSKVVERAKRAYNIKKAYTNYHDLLEQSDVDCVIISTPPSTHADIAVDAAKAGKHILIEKPIAAALEDADRIIKAAAEFNVKLMIGEDARFNPIFVYAHRLVKMGKIGQPIMMKANRRSCAVWWRKDLEMDSWFWDHERGGGPIVEQCIHEIDLSRWFFNDEAIRVYAEGGSFVKNVKCGDNAAIIIRFKKGGISVIDTSFSMPENHPLDIRVELIGSKGFLDMNQLNSPLIIQSMNGVNQFAVDNEPIATKGELADKWTENIRKGQKYRVPFDLPHSEGQKNKLIHFIECIQNNKEPLVSGEDGKKDLEIAIAAHLSISSHNPVQLPLDKGVNTR